VKQASRWAKYWRNCRLLLQLQSHGANG
jgi:uncharacterized protein YjiS (DUF1127 family)